MTDKHDVLRSNEVLDLEEKYLNDKLRRQNQAIALLRRKRRRRIVLRSLALFVGLVLVLYGAVDVIVFKSLEATFGNIIFFVLAELIGLPILIQGIVLFRHMPIDREISAAAEQLVEIQDSLSQLRDERSRIAERNAASIKASPKTSKLAEPLITFEEPLKQDESGVCPSCGKEIRKGTKICRNCGHLFI